MIRNEAEWLSFNDRFDDALDVTPLLSAGATVGGEGEKTQRLQGGEFWWIDLVGSKDGKLDGIPKN